MRLDTNALQSDARARETPRATDKAKNDRSDVAASKALAFAAKRGAAAVTAERLDRNKEAAYGDLKEALGKRRLAGDVKLSLDASGQLAIKASGPDKALLEKVFSEDRSVPSIRSRLRDALTGAAALGTKIQQAAATSYAASTARGPSDLVRLYGAVMGSQKPVDVSITIGAGGAVLSYPGSLVASA